MKPRIQYAKTSDGVSIAYAVFGEGPPIVFPAGAWGDIHLYLSAGLALSVGMADAVVERGWRVVRYDGRGMGASDRSAVDFSIEGRLRDLEAVIDAVGADRFALCGSTQGGPAAISYAVRHPERLSHLILVNSFASGADYYEALPSMRVAKDLRHIAEDQWEFYTLALANALTAFSNSEFARRLAAAFRAGMSPKAFLAYRDAAEDIDVTDLLRSVAVPTLVVRDTSTTFGDFSALAQKLAPHIAAARFVVTEDSAAAIDEFLREGEQVPAPVKAASTPAGGLVTILFTDLVDHTSMMRRLGDEKGRAVLREHERITREALAAHGGAEVKTMGDGFMASFGSVTRAVECAVALQQRFAERNESGAEPLHIRVGLNAGEPIEEDGDLFGETVILASRIAAKAEGGEILASLAVRELCAGKGFLFAELGEHVMKGFEEPVRVFEVRWRE
ncbi:MAG: adenylate/guanylate cyclase domain-containing protein [Dehalococcoidia bacterium]|nr:adenylate/guanylate cyclase domain-containing protein [Dehalococcoidia bacterium]